MKIIKSSGEFNILSDSTLTILDTFPAGIYRVESIQGPQPRISITEDTNFPLDLPKIYGSTDRRVEKIFSTFNRTSAQLGVMLSGLKGSGKSLMIRKLVKEAVYMHRLPVFIAHEPSPLLIPTLRSINQPYVLILDEFDKNFPYNVDNDEKDDIDTQSDFLNFLDGTDHSSKVLTVIALNDIKKISPFFQDRPGRFRYHFKFTAPRGEELDEFLKDNLKVKLTKSQHLKLQAYGNTAGMSYDTLSVICDELNAGYDLNETLEDINFDVSEGYMEDQAITIFFKNKKLPPLSTIDDFIMSWTYVNLRFDLSDIGYSEYDFNCELRFKVATKSAKITSSGIYIPGKDVGVPTCWPKSEDAVDNRVDFIINYYRKFDPKVNLNNLWNIDRIEITRALPAINSMF